MKVTNEIKYSKRELILDTAATLFSEYGFHEVNMEMVARKAGIAKGTIYNYFKSKDEIYFEINLSRLSSLIFELDKKFKSQESVIEDLRGFVIHVFMFLMKYKDFFLIFQRTRLRKKLKENSQIDEKITRLKVMLYQILNEGVEKNIFKPMNICLVSDLILGMIYSSVLRNIDKEIHDESLVKEREELFEFIKESVIALLSITPPLDGKTILFTRSLGQSDPNVGKLKKLGAEVIILTTLKIVPPTSWKDCDDAIKNLHNYDFVVFTSKNSVEWFLKRLALFEKFDELKQKKIISIGKSTQERLNQIGLKVDFIPEKFNSVSLIEGLLNFIPSGSKVLLPQSKIGRDIIQLKLKEAGIDVHRVEVYDVDIPDLTDIENEIKLLNEKDVDLYVFTSPSTFDNFLKIFEIKNPQNFFNDKLIAVIGPTTMKHIENYGIKVTIIPEESTFNSLIEAIIKYFKDYANKK